MIKLGETMPGFHDVTAYHNKNFIKLSSETYHGKWLILFFYPRDFTFICPTELKGFAKHKADFVKLGAEVLAASTDSEWSHQAWFERDLPEVDYPILADTTHQISRSFDVLNEADGSAERGLFIIDPDGLVKYIVISAGSVGRSVKEVLRVLEALQSGGLCPVEWEPGQTTLGKA